MSGRDTFGNGGGFNPNMNFNNFQYIAELERNMAELRMEYNNLRRTTMGNERQLTQYSKELEYLQEENGRLRNDLHKAEQLRAQLEEVSLELERMKADRDFHNEQHLNLRKELLEIVKQEYELDSLRREKVFIEGELKNYKEKSIIYEKQIDELTILAKRPVSKSNSDGSDKQEHYYAKKILELETKLKEFKKQNDELRHENSNYKAGIRTNLDESRLNEAGGFRATTPDSLLEQVNLLKKKNETLKKENDILRKERGNGGDAPKFAGGVSDGNADNKIKELQKQIENLTRKNIKLEQDYMISSGGLEAMELKTKLEEAQRQIAKLKSQPSQGGSFLMDNGMGGGYNDKLQKMVNDLLEENNQLKQQNNELMSSIPEGSSEARVARLTNENIELRAERDRMRHQILDLKNQIEVKDTEIQILKSATTGEGANSDAMYKLMETNQRLLTALTDMQEKMRIMESMNMSVTQGGSMLLPHSQFMAN
jgi:chromosome segregation ATPase